MVELATRLAPMPKAAAWLRVLSPATRFSFNGDAAAREALAPLWGVELSEQACRAQESSTRAALWLGPDEYLLLDTAVTTTAPRMAATTAALFDSLENALSGTPHALVDVSHRQFALEVTGPNAATILSGACPLDLDIREFPVGMCTRTVLAKADIVLWRKREDVFHLEVWRSFAGYVSGILTEIAAGL